MGMVRNVIYQAPQKQFFDDVLHNKVCNMMQNESKRMGMRPSPSEVTSWHNNIPRIKNVLELSGVKDTYVTFEYMLPYTLKRIDCMIYGQDENGKGHAVHIELKQWSNESVKEHDSECNFEVSAYTGGGVRVVAHPSQQVRSYSDYLSGFIEVVSNNTIEIDGMAYCYNYSRHREPSALYADRYKNLLREYRTYSSDEVEEMAEDLMFALKGGNGMKIFNTMMMSRIRPSRKLLDSAAEMIDQGNANAFSLLDEQIVARNMILDKIRKKTKKKSVIIVKGGPGTGKTVIALHILAMLAHERKSLNVRYATKSKPLLEGVKYQLRRGSPAKLLFSNITTYNPNTYQENELDVLLVDEAHRITQSGNTQYTRANMRTDMPLVDTLIRASRISVFFIDDKQGIRSMEIGSSMMIRAAAISYGADIEEVELKSQFRCNGSDNYLDWLEQVLYGDRVSAEFTEDEYDFKIFDSPQEVYDKIVEQNNVPGQTARMTAGFCWPWSPDLDPLGNFVNDIKIGSFAMPWETKDSINPIPEGYVKWYEWAYKPEGIKQVGCIYTAQGFEFDYVGVIVGPDLRYDSRNNCLVTDINATKDPMLKRGRVRFDDYVRNIYRVLMSRGMKGCYVYFCDPEVKKYFQEMLKSPNME